MQERIGKHLPGVTAVLSLIPLPAFTAGASPESGEYRGGEESGQHNGGGPGEECRRGSGEHRGG